MGDIGEISYTLKIFVDGFVEALPPCRSQVCILHIVGGSDGTLTLHREGSDVPVKCEVRGLAFKQHGTCGEELTCLCFKTIGDNMASQS